MIIAI